MTEAETVIVREPPTKRWTGSLLAALPHLILATTMAMSGASSGAAPSWFIALRYGLLVMMGVALLLAWRLRWPLWSGSWAGYWLLFLYFWVSEQLAWRPGLDYLLLLPLAGIGLLLFRRRSLYGLLAIVAPLLLMTRVFVFELFTGGDWVWSGIWLLLALTAGTIVWLDSIRAGVLLTLAFQLATGLIFSIARSYLPYRSPPGMEMGPRPVPELETLVNDFAPLTLAAITIPMALLLLHPLRRLAELGGRGGRRSHRLLLLGMFLTFGSLLALRTRPSLLNELSLTSSTVTSVAVAAGLLLSLGAAFVLTRAVWSGPGTPLHDLLLPLLSAFAPLVVFALAPPFAPDGRYSDRLQMQIILSYAGVLTWTILALMILVWRRVDPSQPEIRIQGGRG